MAASNFKEAVRRQFVLLFVVSVFLLVVSISRAKPPNPANACARIGRTQSYIVGLIFAAAMLLFKVITEVGTKGIASVAAGWKRASLRGMFLLAGGLSFTAFLLTVTAGLDGYRYCTRRSAMAMDGYGYMNYLKAGFLVVVMALMQGQLAWVAAVSQN